MTIVTRLTETDWQDFFAAVVPEPGGWLIEDIRIPRNRRRRGEGTKELINILTNARSSKVNVFLHAYPYECCGMDITWRKEQEMLIRWYASYGFVHVGSGWMYWLHSSPPESLGLPPEAFAIDSFCKSLGMQKHKGFELGAKRIDRLLFRSAAARVFTAATKINLDGYDGTTTLVVLPSVINRHDIRVGELWLSDRRGGRDSHLWLVVNVGTHYVKTAKVDRLVPNLNCDIYPVYALTPVAQFLAENQLVLSVNLGRFGEISAQARQVNTARLQESEDAVAAPPEFPRKMFALAWQSDGRPVLSTSETERGTVVDLFPTHRQAAEGLVAKIEQNIKEFRSGERDIREVTPALVVLPVLEHQDATLTDLYLNPLD